MIKARPRLPVPPGLYIHRVFNVGGRRQAAGRLQRQRTPRLTSPLAEVSSTDRNEQVPVLHACGKSLQRGRWASRRITASESRLQAHGSSAGFLCFGLFSWFGLGFVGVFCLLFAFSPFSW